MPEQPDGISAPRTIELPRSVTLALVGGFLGAGKTTAIGALASELSSRGLRVAIVTNDQAPGLVDTAIGTRGGWPVAEVAGGCFCCRYDDMLDAVISVLPTMPDVLLCEPVGSCTDMAATVLNPFKVFYPECFRLAPFVVLIDPMRARDVVLEERPPLFGAEVAYIFRKQLEESDVIALSKCDRIPDAEVSRIAGLLERRFARPVLLTAATQNRGIPELADAILSQQPAGGYVLSDIDYDTYARGEAELGWLNATVHLQARQAFDAAAFARTLVDAVRTFCAAVSAEIAHLKVAVDGGKDFVRVHVTSTSAPSERYPDRSVNMDAARLLINVRIAINPARLEEIVRSSLRETAGAVSVDADVETLRCFSPAYPRPPYRMPSIRLIQPSDPAAPGGEHARAV